MPADASFRDLILAIRADEACHRETNHHFAGMKIDADVDHSAVNLKQDGEYTYT